MNTTWFFDPRFHVFQHDLSLAGMAAFAATVAIGLISAIIQHEKIRLFLTRLGLDKNFVAIATGIVGLTLLISSIVVGLNLGGLAVHWEAPMPGIGISIGRLLRLVVMLVAVFWAVSSFKRFLFDRYLNRMGMDRALQYAIAQICGYFALLLGVFIVLQNAGIDLSALTIFAGAVGVGVGFGLQNVTSNFISGLVVLAERPIQIGDRVELDKVAGQITAIHARSTTVLTNDNIAIVVPNSHFIEKAVTNWTHADPKVRFRIPIGVAYGSEVEKVRELLLSIAREHPAALKEPEPVVFFDGFGDNSLNFELGVWSAEMSSRPRRFRSDLNFAIERKLREAGIEIPFPQRDVYIRSAPPGLADGVRAKQAA
jgi:small-conductance mechanosensitive channel